MGLTVSYVSLVYLINPGKSTSSTVCEMVGFLANFRGLLKCKCLK